MIHSPFVTSLFFIWVGIAFCIIQSAIFSGLNLAIFSVSKLRLEVEAAGGNRDAISLLGLRKDSNLTLSAVLWGNVTINVLLTLLSDSVLAGIGAFAFSTFVITLFGEIIPQAYFSRHALRMAARLTPLLKVYQVVLFPVAKPTAIFLNWWLGPEGITFLRERDFRAFITRHVGAAGADVGELEAIGALNFLDLDDIAVLDEGEPVDPRSVITLPIENERPMLPKFERSPNDPFLRQLDTAGKKWVSNAKMNAYHAGLQRNQIKASVAASRCARLPLRPCPFNFFSNTGRGIGIAVSRSDMDDRLSSVR